ncbi:MAG: hypothetical protein ACRBN8_45535 [Nannocystales bacterium]
MVHPHNAKDLLRIAGVSASSDKKLPRMAAAESKLVGLRLACMLSPSPV